MEQNKMSYYENESKKSNQPTNKKTKQKPNNSNTNEQNSLKNEKKSQNNGSKQEKHKNKSKNKKTPVGLIVTCSILGGMVLGLGTLLYFSYQNSQDYAMKLENVYQKAYYDFADNINNAEIKLSKALTTSDSVYSEKLLAEVSKNATEAEEKLNNLPVSVNGLEKSLSFINQVSGFTQTMSQKLADGQELSANERETLESLRQSLAEMKTNIGDMTTDMKSGYAILSDSLSLDGDYNQFTLNLQSIKSNDVEYPTMIYDGPFSDTQIRKEVKGLKGELVDMETARESLSVIINVAVEDIYFMNQTSSRFETYDFKFSGEAGETYAQITKKGAKLLTMSSYTDSSNVNISREDAINIASEFIIKSGINDVECVWSDIIGGNAYLNFAPVEDEVILYPDLIKVKVDLGQGSILGYEATNYYTNHNDNRDLTSFDISLSTARNQVSDEFRIRTEKKVLAPIEYSEILCFEFACNNDNEDYFFYVDAQTGNMVNVLKVVKTEDGNKLM